MKSTYSTFPFSAYLPYALPPAAGPTQPGALALEAAKSAGYQHLRQLLGQLPVAMYLVRGPAHVLEVMSLPAAAAWGCSVDQVRGQPFFEALPHLRGQGYEAAYATVWQTHQAVTWQEAPLTVAQELPGPTGLGYFNVSFQPFYEGRGRLTGILVTSQDVTEQVLARQQVDYVAAELAATNAGLADYVRELTQAAHAAQAHAEAQTTLLTQSLEQVPGAIGLLVGTDYVIEVCTPGLRALWGRTLAQVLHQPLFAVLPELQGQGLPELLAEVARTGAPLAGHQLHQLPGPSAPTTAAVQFSYYPLRPAQGHPSAIVAVASVGCAPQPADQ
ncbi:hypothetical protein GCM10027422_35320 [Hymenobacter arcticus]